MSYTYKKLLLRALVAVIVIAAMIVLTQDYQIFPGLLQSVDPKAAPPAGVEEFTVVTDDNEKIAVWRLEADASTRLPYTAILFHGNFGSLSSFFGFQRWLKSQGITSYGFDYRGYGKSSGWPSEQGLYLDSHAVWDAVQKREGISAKSLILFGLSLGTGPASELASKIQPKALLLVSPYSSIPDVAAESLILRPLLGFLRYELPTARYVSTLNDTCLVVVHGKQDYKIKFGHGERVFESYKGKAGKFFISDATAGHDDVFHVTRRSVGASLMQCLEVS